MSVVALREKAGSGKIRTEHDQLTNQCRERGRENKKATNQDRWPEPRIQETSIVQMAESHRVTLGEWLGKPTPWEEQVRAREDCWEECQELTSICLHMLIGTSVRLCPRFLSHNILAFGCR